MSKSKGRLIVNDPTDGYWTPTAVKCTDDLNNVSFVRRSKSKNWQCILSNGIQADLSYAGVPSKLIAETEIKLDTCKDADAVLVVLKSVGYLKMKYELI